MNRRNFLTNTLRFAAGSAAAGAVGLLSGKVFAKEAFQPAFSLDALTGEPDRAIRMIESFLAHSPLKSAKIRFSETPMSGSHVGDLVFVKSQQLIDFRKHDGALSAELREIASALALPRRVEHPVMVRFSSQEPSAAAKNIDVFSGGVLVKQLPIDANRESFRVEGLKGFVDVRIQGKSAKITNASCKHKTCMNLGKISRPGQRLICVPNQITVAIAGQNAFGVDSVSF